MLKWLILVCFASAQAAEIYSWRDKDGVMHFGEKAPENAIDVKKKVIADIPPTTEATERDHINDSQRLLRAFDEERADKNKQRAQKKAEQLQREQQCEIAKDNLQKFEISSRRTMTQQDGTQRDLSPAEDRLYEQQMRDAVSQLCR